MSESRSSEWRIETQNKREQVDISLRNIPEWKKKLHFWFILMVLVLLRWVKFYLQQKQARTFFQQYQSTIARTLEAV